MTHETLQKNRVSQCSYEDLQKNGRAPNSEQRYNCKECNKTFRLNYAYRAWQPGVKQKIDNQTLNSSAVRDIGRNLGIEKDTVVRHLKKRRLPLVNPYIEQAVFEQPIGAPRELDVTLHITE